MGGLDIIDTEDGAGDTMASAQPSPPPPAVVAAQAQAADDAKLGRLGWQGIGVSEKAARLMESFEVFAGGKVIRTIDATHGSMMRAVASAAERMVWLEERMNEIQSKPNDQITAEELMKLQMYHDQWKDCAKISKDCNGEAVKAAHIRVLMASKMVERASKTRNKKPGWKRAIPTGGARQTKGGAT